MTKMISKKSRSRNALVHGLYTKDVLLPWDSKEDFKRLHEDLKAELCPHGRAEEEPSPTLPFSIGTSTRSGACGRAPC